MAKLFEEIDDGVFRIIAKRSNVYLLTDEQLTLIDAGMPEDKDTILTCIREISRDPGEINHILVTHAHMDHIGSLAALKKTSGAKVVANAQEVDYIQGLKKTWTMGREGFGGKLFKVALFFLEAFIFNYEPAGVDIPCNGDENIDCFGGIKAIATPGHSPGSMCYYHSEKKLLFTGDALSGMSDIKLPPRMGCADYEAALQSVKRLAELDSNMCLFGHGDPILRDASSVIKAIVPQ
jgi:glyoxylase-like metal-dependent hydrolase (beta-lactamase superfamily II)